MSPVTSRPRRGGRKPAKIQTSLRPHMHINHSKYNQSTGIPTRPADIRRTATSVELNTHDFALAELRGRLRNLKGGDYGPKILKLSPSNQIQDESQAAIESAVEHHVPSIENVYDAFTGGHIGTVSGDQEGAPSDEMWNHLAKIRHLQSEIATMHLTMEGLGSGIELEKPADDSEADNLDETKSVKEHTFSQLESRFLGRKNAVEAVMSKASAHLVVLFKRMSS